MSGRCFLSPVKHALMRDISGALVNDSWEIRTTKPTE